MSKKRRNAAEVAAAVKRIDRLVAGGMKVTAAAEKVGLSDSVYARAKKATGSSGSMDIASLPPRPKRGGQGDKKKKRVNEHDVAAVAKAISRLDVRLAAVAGLGSERRRLADILINLLKKP